MRPFVASPPIARRHARQRITEERRRQALLIAQLFAAITLSQCQRIGPKARRERRRRIVGKQFGHFSFPRLTSHAAALGHASTLAKAWRSPVAIGTKSGRRRRAPRLFFSCCPRAEGASQRERRAGASTARLRGEASRNMRARALVLIHRDAHTLICVSRPHLACTLLRMRMRSLLHAEEHRSARRRRRSHSSAVVR